MDLKYRTEQSVPYPSILGLVHVADCCKRGHKHRFCIKSGGMITWENWMMMNYPVHYRQSTNQSISKSLI